MCILLVLTNKSTVLDVNTFLLLITLLHISMCEHCRPGFSSYVKVTRSVKVKSSVIYRCHSRITRLKHYVILYSKLVTILKFYPNIMH